LTPRSWLFVPADSDRKLARIAGCGADAVILDLEDAVVPERKVLAREAAAAFLQAHAERAVPATWVRINPYASGLAGADLAAVLPARPAGIVLPKPDSVNEVVRLDAELAAGERALDVSAGSIRVMAIATETALAVTALPGYAAAPPRLAALTWGAEDLSAEFGAAGNRDADGELHFTYRVVRSLCQVAAAAAGVPIIETLWPDFRDADGLRRSATRACDEGFSGMLAIHPDQVAIINEAFTPDAARVAHARRVVAAFAAAAGTGTVALDGRMLDRPHLRQAQRLLEVAASLGVAGIGAPAT
jgi:citrate lyase subunit beta/citryl-CoA lyase